MHSYILSDLHLTPERPEVTAAFFKFLQTDALSAEQIYLLGDLFEFWIGDDASGVLGADPVLTEMAKLSESVDCYFMAGNRDFLVGEGFTEQTGFTILPDETVVDLYGTPTLLLHGDSLCTDDIGHQEFRRQIVTNRDWCEQFLKLDIEQRIEQALAARMQSNEHKSEISMGIMDVTEQAVAKAFTKYQVKRMVHGHTHRQNTHTYKVDGQQATRYVLGDWHTSSSVMRVSSDGIEIDNQPI